MVILPGEFKTKVFLPQSIKIIKKIVYGGQAKLFCAKLLEPPEGWTAIKLYAKDPVSSRGFHSELFILSRARHPSVVKMIGIVESRDNIGILFELLSGVSLSQMLSYLLRVEHFAMPIDLIRYLLRKLLEVLLFVHGGMNAGTEFPLGLLHGDLSPGNIFLCSSGGVKLIDFGAAKEPGILGPEMMPFGKTRFLAPEVLRENIFSTFSEIYAAGVVAFEIVMLQPFNHRKAIFELARLESKIKGQDPKLFFIIKAMMAPSPFLRLSNAKVCLDALGKVTKEEENKLQRRLAKLVLKAQKHFPNGVSCRNKINLKED